LVLARREERLGRLPHERRTGEPDDACDDAAVGGERLTAAGRQVIDRTGLDWRFDADLEWFASPDAVGRVSVFTAVRERPGLRLVPRHSDSRCSRCLVVAGIERPSEN
jgi:uncharacterized protein (TIGR03435 family)